jgi:hypothetical protein
MRMPPPAMEGSSHELEHDSATVQIMADPPKILFGKMLQPATAVLIQK